LSIINNGRIKELREDRDYTQANVASVLKITHQQYQLYEANKRKLPIDLLKILCLFYNVSADYVLGLPKGLKWLR